MTTHQNGDPSDTDYAARKSVFAAETPRNRRSGARAAQRPKTKRSAAANVATASSTVPPSDAVEDREAGADEGLDSAPVTAETAEKAKGSFELRRWIEEHPVAAAAAAVGAIGVGVVGYRWVRHSLPVRLYLALRFGRFRELIRV